MPMNRLMLITGLASPQRNAAVRELGERGAHVIEVGVLEEQGPGGPLAPQIAAGAALADALDHIVTTAFTVVDGLEDPPTLQSLLQLAGDFEVETQAVVFVNATEADADVDQAAAARRKVDQAERMCDVVDVVDDGGQTFRIGSSEPARSGVVDAVLS
jgi:hypothetical protein